MRERSHGARDSKNRDKMNDPVKMDGFERQEFPQVRDSGKEKSHNMFDEKKQYDQKAYEKNDAFKSKGDDSKTLKQDSTRKPGEIKPKTDIDKPYDGIDNNKYPQVKDQGKPVTKPKDIDDIDYMFADDKKSTVKDAGKDLNLFGDAKTDGKKDTAKPKPDEKKPDIKKPDEKKVDEKKVDIKKPDDDPFEFDDEDDDSDIFSDTKKKIPMKNDEKPKADTKPKETKPVEQPKPKETKPVEQPKPKEAVVIKKKDSFDFEDDEF